MSVETQLLTDLKSAAADLLDISRSYIRQVLNIPADAVSDEELRSIRAPWGPSKASKNIMQQLPYVAASNATLVIQGQTGTGKGALAYLIHLVSGKDVARYQRLNLAGYPPDLAWAHVIGHTADAFTGPKKGKLGAYCLAHKGTLFVDEFDETRHQVQLLFLDITQRTRKRLRRVGSSLELIEEIDSGFLEKDLTLSKKTKRTEDKRLLEIINGIKEAREPKVRLIFGVARDLKESVEAGNFRLDLYYRVNVASIALPPLVERREDMPGLVGLAVQEFDEKNKIKGFCPEFYEQLCNHEWPGNVRQLRNVIQLAVMYSAKEDGVVKYSKWLEPAMLSVYSPKIQRGRKQYDALPDMRTFPKSKVQHEVAEVLNETISDRNPTGSYNHAAKLLQERGIFKCSNTSISNMVKSKTIRLISGKYTPMPKEGS